MTEGQTVLTSGQTAPDGRGASRWPGREPVDRWSSCGSHRRRLLGNGSKRPGETAAAQSLCGGKREGHRVSYTIRLSLCTKVAIV